MQLLLTTWRELGCHLELPDALPRLFPSLKQSLGAAAVLIRRVDVPSSRLETVASAQAADPTVSRSSRLK